MLTYQYLSGALSPVPIECRYTNTNLGNRFIFVINFLLDTIFIAILLMYF